MCSLFALGLRPAGVTALAFWLSVGRSASATSAASQKSQGKKMKTGASTERASPDNNERAPSEKVVKARNAREAVALITCERVLLVERMTYIEFIEEQLKTIWDSLSGIAAEHEQINEALQELSKIVAENQDVYVEPEGGGRLTNSLK